MSERVYANILTVPIKPIFLLNEDPILLYSHSLLISYNTEKI